MTQESTFLSCHLQGFFFPSSSSFFLFIPFCSPRSHSCFSFVIDRLLSCRVFLHSPLLLIARVIFIDICCINTSIILISYLERQEVLIPNLRSLRRFHSARGSLSVLENFLGLLEYWRYWNFSRLLFSFFAHCRDRLSISSPLCMCLYSISLLCPFAHCREYYRFRGRDRFILDIGSGIDFPIWEKYVLRLLSSGSISFFYMDVQEKVGSLLVIGEFFLVHLFAICMFPSVFLRLCRCPDDLFSLRRMSMDSPVLSQSWEDEVLESPSRCFQEGMGLEPLPANEAEAILRARQACLNRDRMSCHWTSNHGTNESVEEDQASSSQSGAHFGSLCE